MDVNWLNRRLGKARNSFRGSVHGHTDGEADNQRALASQHPRFRVSVRSVPLICCGETQILMMKMGDGGTSKGLDEHCMHGASYCKCDDDAGGVSEVMPRCHRNITAPWLMLEIGKRSGVRLNTAAPDSEVCVGMCRCRLGPNASHATCSYLRLPAGNVTGVWRS